MNRMIIAALGTVLALFGTACSIDVERNDDGSLQVTSSITETVLESEIRRAIADPLVRDFTVDLEDGFVLVGAERDEVFGDATATLSFRLDLSVVDGHLGAEVSQATLNGDSIPQALVDVWNERLATQLERAGKRNPDSTLERVEITADDVTMEWHVETAQSRG